MEVIKKQNVWSFIYNNAVHTIILTKGILKIFFVIDKKRGDERNANFGYGEGVNFSIF